MRLPEWLQSARRVGAGWLHRRGAATDEAVSAALQSAGLLSVLLFLVRNAFELFAAHGLYESQHRLIAAFDGVLALWAFAEVARFARSRTAIPLGRLTAALGVQVAVGAVRALIDLTAPAPDGPFERLGKPFEFGLAAIFVPVHAIVFLVIGKLIIDAFSQAERASAAKQRRRLKRKLESSLMASAVAHEIKLPLSTILLRTRVALESGDAVAGELERLAARPRVKGVRRLLQDEADDAFCLRPDFVRAVRRLGALGLVCDLCIYHRQLGAVAGELEFQRFARRYVLGRVLQGCDLVQVVCGSPAWANSVLGCGKPVALQVSTRAVVERVLRDGTASGFMGRWRRNLDQQYGSGQLITRKTGAEGDVSQTLSGYRWTLGNTTVDLICFTAERGPERFQTLSVHYRLF